MQYIFSTSSQIESKKKIVWLMLFDVNIHTPHLSSSMYLIIARDEFKWQHAKLI